MSSVRDIVGMIGRSGPVDVPAARADSAVGRPAASSLARSISTAYDPSLPADHDARGSYYINVAYQQARAKIADMIRQFDPDEGVSPELLERNRELKEQYLKETIAGTVLSVAGAHAAPTATDGDPASSGGGSTLLQTAARVGVTLLADGVTAKADETKRQLLQSDVEVAAARLQRVSSSLRRDFPKAASLASTSTGWDPEQFTPRTREQAEAFAQRMVVDMVEAAAKLDLVAAQREAARFEVAASGSMQARSQLSSLDLTFARQQATVDKLARLVDASSNGSVSTAGASARRSSGAATAASDARRVSELRAHGADERTVIRILGASELASDEERSPGGSTRVRAITTSMAEFTWVHRSNLRAARAAELRRMDDERRSDERRSDERRSEERRAERRRRDQIAVGRAQQRRLDFQAWIERLDAEGAQRRQAAG